MHMYIYIYTSSYIQIYCYECFSLIIAIVLLVKATAFVGQFRNILDCSFSRIVGLMRNIDFDTEASHISIEQPSNSRGRFSNLIFHQLPRLLLRVKEAPSLIVWLYILHISYVHTCVHMYTYYTYMHIYM